MKISNTFFAYLLTLLLPISLISNEVSSAKIKFIEMETQIARTKGDGGNTIQFKNLGKSWLQEILATDANSTIYLNNFPISINESKKLVLITANSVTDIKSNSKKNSAIQTTDNQPIVNIGTRDGNVVYKVTTKSYDGYIENEPNSKVSITIVNEGIVAVIEREDKTKSIFTNVPESQTDYMISDAETMKFNEQIEEKYRCLGSQSPNNQTLEKKYALQQDPSKDLIVVKMAVEGDFEYFKSAGKKDINLTTAYTIALFNQVSNIYKYETGITFKLTWMKFWNDSIADPYKVAGNAYALTDTARNYWKLNYKNVDRDLFHVFTSVNYGGGGFGYYNAPCVEDYDMAVSSPTGLFKLPNYSFNYDTYILAHEIGHNFGAAHTFDCFWNPPLDTCYTKDDASLGLGDACYGLPVTPRKSTGSIMSYCPTANYVLSNGNFNEFKCNMTFLEKPINQIRKTALEYIKNNCIAKPSEPYIAIRYPRGYEYIYDATRIEWASVNVDSVSIYYSQNGLSWIPIATNIPNEGNSYLWKFSNLNANVFLKVCDAKDTTVKDQSLSRVSARPNSVEENSSENEITYYNQSTNELIIENTKSRFANEVEIFDYMGKLKTSYKVNQSENANYLSIHLKNFTSGVYFAKYNSSLIPFTVIE